MEQFAKAPAGIGVVGYDELLCRTCSKRQSPLSSQLGISSNGCDAESEPRAKKPMIHNSNYHPLLESDYGLNGYAEIKLPIDFSAAMNLTASSDSPLLRRCVSDPYNSPGDGSKNNAGGLENDGALRRCISDPYHPPGVMPKNQAGVVASTSSPARGMSPGGGLPPLYPGTSRLSTDVVTPPKVATECLTGQSPDSLRLKRMKQRMKEMAQWWIEAVSEDEETPDAENHNAAGNSATAATSSQYVDEKELEEQIGVEKVGDGLKIMLKCPCGSGYELLITGQCCYYKIL